MCDRHSNYTYRYHDYRVENVNGESLWRRDFFDAHKNLVPYSKWNETKIKVENKLKEITQKRVQRSKDILHDLVDCSKIKVDELYWDLTREIESYDLKFRQYACCQSMLEHYLEENDYLDGIKNLRSDLPYDLGNRIFCQNCHHSMYNHAGEYYEKECHGSGDTICKCVYKGKEILCQKFVLSSDDKLMLQKLSGTVPYSKGLDGGIALGEKLAKLLSKRSSSSPSTSNIVDGLLLSSHQAWEKRNGKEKFKIVDGIFLLVEPTYDESPDYMEDDDGNEITDDEDVEEEDPMDEDEEDPDVVTEDDKEIMKQHKELKSTMDSFFQ